METEFEKLIESITILNRTNTKLLNDRFRMTDELMRLRKEVIALRKGVDYDLINKLETELETAKELNFN